MHVLLPYELGLIGISLWTMFFYFLGYWNGRVFQAREHAQGRG
jgi:hypothetical protein